LFFGWQELDLNSKFHRLSIVANRQYYKRLRKERLFLPRLKYAGLRSLMFL
jgi:hypothetical protein